MTSKIMNKNDMRELVRSWGGLDGDFFSDAGTDFLSFDERIKI